MAAMRRPVPAAGKPRAARRAALRLLCGAALSGCAPAVVVPETAVSSDGKRTPEFLAPVARVHGGFLRQADATRPGSFLTLRAPITAVARGLDVFIADAGHRALFHYDLATQSLQPLAGLDTGAGLRLCALGDRSLLVLDLARDRLLRVSREGRVLAQAPQGMLAGGALDLACDEAQGRIWIAHPGSARLLEVRPALANAVPLVVQPQAVDPVGQLTALAAVESAVFALEPARSRVVQLDAGARVLRTFGETVLRQPRAIAADRHRRVYVADGFDNRLHVFVDGQAVAAWTAQQLGVVAFSDLRIAQSDLAIADAQGARVHLFRVPRDGSQR